MNLSKISIRYAKALFEFATEKKCIDAVKADMELLLNACVSNNEFKTFLANPTVTVSQKKTFFETLLKTKVKAETMQFLLLVVDNKRELFLEGIVRNFLERYRESKGVKSVTLSSSAPMSDAQKNKLIGFVEKKYNVKVELTEKIDKDLIGGFVLRVEDEQYDMSIASKLSKLRHTLLQAKI